MEIWARCKDLLVCGSGEKNDEKIRRQRRWETGSGRIPKVIQPERSHRDKTKTTDTHTPIIADSWVQRKRRIEGEVGLTLEVDEEALNRARARDGAASPRYRLADKRSSWLSYKRGTSCPQNHLFWRKRWHPFTPLAGLVLIKRPGVGAYD